MLVTMSDKELSRINVIQSVVEKRMRRRDAAHQLALTERQTQRLMNRFRESGVAGLVNLRRGRPGNHRLPESLKLRVLSLLHDHYSDFGPTLAAEKLRELHNITVSVETLRKWMTADGLWVPYSRRRPRVHQPRYRRDCLGELVQIDGSPHDWFEGRAPKCCLLVFIDDATSRLMHLRFGETESAFVFGFWRRVVRRNIRRPAKAISVATVDDAATSSITEMPEFLTMAGATQSTSTAGADYTSAIADLFADLSQRESVAPFTKREQARALDKLMYSLELSTTESGRYKMTN